jgi:hypothetical protein
MATHNYYNSSDLNMWREYQGVFEGNGGFNFGKTTVNVFGALRFTNIDIPQGTVASSAIVHIYVQDNGTGTGDLKAQYWGIDEDNTDDFSSGPMGRTHTTASHSPNISVVNEGGFQNLDVTDEVNEILARGGWSSGNAIGFLFQDRDGSPEQVYLLDMNTGEDTNSYLSITFNEPSGSASMSPSSSISASPSPTASPSASASFSPSPSPLSPFYGLRVAKPGYNVLADQEPHHLIFSSDYGTLKYYVEETATISIDAGAGNIAGTTTITHNLGYYPYVEVFVNVYIGSSDGTYEYCPFAGSGAVVEYDANYKITTTGITLYTQINGVSESVWSFDFLVFIYKNNLNLS